jgi:uncharacterized repeat protein (TIGR01451 family)
LKITKTANRRQLAGGSKVTYTIRVGNMTRQAAVKVNVCDRVPGQMSIVRISNNGKLNNGKVCWLVDFLAGNKSRTFKIVLRSSESVNNQNIRNVAFANALNVKRRKTASAKVKVQGSNSRQGGITG